MAQGAQEGNEEVNVGKVPRYLVNFLRDRIWKKAAGVRTCNNEVYVSLSLLS